MCHFHRHTASVEVIDYPMIAQHCQFRLNGGCDEQTSTITLALYVVYIKMYYEIPCETGIGLPRNFGVNT